MFGGEKPYLPLSKRHFPLSFFRLVTLVRKKNRPMTRSADSVQAGILTPHGYDWFGPPSHVLGLHLGNIGKDVSVGENLAMAQTFLNKFVKADGNHPVTDFKTPGWVHFTNKQWWSNLTLYILEYFNDDLKRLGLREAVRATCYGIEVIVPNFYTLFELYYPSSRMFFALVGELGMALHEM